MGSGHGLVVPWEHPLSVTHACICPFLHTGTPVCPSVSSSSPHAVLHWSPTDPPISLYPAPPLPSSRPYLNGKEAFRYNGNGVCVCVCVRVRISDEPNASFAEPLDMEDPSSGLGVTKQDMGQSKRAHRGGHPHAHSGGAV